MDEQKRINEAISEINRDIAQIAFAAFLIQPLITGKITIDLALFGFFG
jgi:hypothetical protein